MQVELRAEFGLNYSTSLKGIIWISSCLKAYLDKRTEVSHYRPNIWTHLLLWLPLEFSHREKRGGSGDATAGAAGHPALHWHATAHQCPTLPATDRQVTLSSIGFSHRYFKPCRLYAGQMPIADAGHGDSCTMRFGGGFSVLFPRKGYAELRLEAWESKAPLQGAWHSKAIPDILPVLLCISYTVQCPMHTHGERANRAAVPGSTFHAWWVPPELFTA